MFKKTLVSTLLLAISHSAMAEKQSLNLFIWNDYIDQNIVQKFEQQCDCQVTQDYYSSTEEMMAKLMAGASGYDVVVPTQNAVQALIQQNKLSKLDKAALPNLKNIDSGYLDRDYDPGNQYSVPYAFTTTIVGFNQQKVEQFDLDPSDWSIIFDTAQLKKIKGKVTVLNESTELFGSALRYLGYSANDRNKAHLQEAKALIQEAKPYWAAFNSSSYIKELSVGNIWVAHGYSSDMVQARADALDAGREFEINYQLPEQGAVLALDNMVIPANADNKPLAHRFINFMMDGKNAATLSNEIGAGNPNAAAAQYIRPELKANQAIFPDQDTLKNLETLQDQNRRERRMMSRMWTEIKIK